MRQWIALGALSILAGNAAAETGPKLQINPQVGVSISTLSTDAEELDSEGRTGIFLGGNIRFGMNESNTVYLAPGIYFQQIGATLKSTEDLGPGDFDLDDEVKISSLAVPLLLGAQLGQGESVTFRLFAGPVGTLVTGVGDNDFDLEKDDLKSAILGAMGGVGIDFLNLTVDASYEYGFGEVFEEDTPGGENATSNVVRVAAGIKLIP